jgi:thioredoxin reductase (NADPH)
VLYNTNPIAILPDSVILAQKDEKQELKITNDLVYIFAGGELPTQFLEKAGVQITKKFGEAILKHGN